MNFLKTSLRILFFLMIINLFIIPLPAQEGWREKEMEVKVMLRDRHDADKLNSLKLNGDIYTNFATMYVTPQELEKIRISELNYVIQIENLNNYFRDFWENRDAYHTYEEIIALMDSLAETLPGICMKTVYGESLGGRELSAIKISDNVQLDENEPEMAFDGNIHGDEIGGGENTIRFARYLCQQYGENPEITELVNNREIWIFPLVNPDGRVNMTRYNNNGVDLNRDWGYLWDATGGSPGAYSQPESKALRQMVYENQFNIHMTFHSGIEMFLHPWYFREEPCPDNAQELELADVYAGNSGYSNLTTGPGTSLYPTNGSTAEALYGVMGSHGIVMELSSDKQPPASQLGYYFGINLEPMIKMIEYAGYGIEGTITDAETSDPVAAAVFIGNTLPCYSDPEVGDFHKFIMPGTYSIIVRANGYQTKLVENIGVVYNDVTIADIELEPEAHQSIYRIDATRIPGGNMADEGTTWYAIGPPDNMNYSLGQNGWIVFDMQELVVDGEGDDIIVFEGDASPEGFTLYAGPTMDGPWSMVGSGNGTTEFDLAESTQSEARFFKIQDDNSGPGGDNAGFDLDAVQALSFISGVYILLDEVVIDDASGNNNGLLDAGETAIFNTYLKNIGTEDATNIFGTLTCSDEYIEIFTTTPQEFGNILVGESAWATFTVHAGEMTPFGHSSMFTLGYTGDNNLSGSKIFEISFQDYCEASTNTEDEYIANVLFGEINNTSGWQGGVANYTDISTILEPGVSQEMSITNGNAWASDYVTVWIDWNRNMEFEAGQGEQYILTNVGGSGQTFEGNIAPDASQIPGSFRLRIRMTYSTAPVPCGSSSYGEVEDYTVIIPGEILTANFVANETEICQGGDVQFSDNSIGNIVSWNWQFPGGEPSTSTVQNPVVIYQNAGTYDVTLEVTGESTTNLLTMEGYIHVNPLPEVTFAEIEDMCLNWPAQQLTQGYPEGGEYSGTGVETGWFYPEVAGLGAHTITYIFADMNGCENSAEQTVYVDACTEIDERMNGVSIQPNPGNGTFRVISKTGITAQKVEMLNAGGKTIFTMGNVTISDESPLTISLPDPEPGIYFLKLTGDEAMIFKVIVR